MKSKDEAYKKCSQANVAVQHSDGTNCPPAPPFPRTPPSRKRNEFLIGTFLYDAFVTPLVSTGPGEAAPVAHA